MREQLKEYAVRTLPPGFAVDADLVEEGIRLLAWFLADESSDVVEKTCQMFYLVVGARNANFVISTTTEYYKPSWQQDPQCSQFLQRLNDLMDAGPP